MPQSEHPESSVPRETESTSRTAIQPRPSDDSFDPIDEPSHSGTPKRWLMILGVLLLVFGSGFLGWRWWQSRQAGAANGGALGAAQSQAAPVEIATVQTSTVRATSEFVGKLEAKQSVPVRPEIDGRVSQILVEEGDPIQAGTPIVRLDPDQRQAQSASATAAANAARAARNSAEADLRAAEAERATNLAEVELQEEEFRRISVLVEEGALAQQRLDQVRRDLATAKAALNASNQRIQAAQADVAEAEALFEQSQAESVVAREELQDATVVAPFAGIVGNIEVKPGSYVTAGDDITTITQNQAFDLQLSLPLQREDELRLGIPVRLMSAQGQPLATGEISFISPQINTETQTILAEATFSNQNGQLRDGQFVRAQVIWNEQPGILIPTTAIARLGGETFVFVAQRPDSSPALQKGQTQSGQPQTNQPQWIAQQRPVKLGDIQDNAYQVLGGLEAGDRLIVSGVLNLTDGAPISPKSQIPQ